MNWNDSKVFLAIARGGSLNAAARELRQNHSTVFRRLNALEEALSCRLFDRLPQGYQLTEHGQTMFKWASQAESAMDALQREIAGQDLQPRGIVRLTTAPNLARSIVPIALVELRQKFPEIVVEVCVGDAESDLNRREADLALRATNQPPEHLVGRQIAEIGWNLCGVGREGPRDAQQLVDLPLIGAEAALMRLPAMQWLEKHFSAQVVARASDLSTMAALASAGLGLAALPEDQIEAKLHRYFRIPNISGGLWLLTHPDLRQMQKIRVVWDELRLATGLYLQASPGPTAT